jgi:hypothetical protein
LLQGEIEEVEMMHTKSESDVTSLAASSPPRSPKRPPTIHYYVQSPSRDSAHDGGGGGYNNSSYGNGGEGYDAGRTPMYINTREVHVYGAPTNSDGDDQRRGGGSGGFFGPALHAVGHFVDRRFGLDSRN